MEDKIIIYDFDGTLTKRKIPIYPGLIKACNKISMLKVFSVAASKIKSEDIDLYLRYYNFLFEVMNISGNFDKDSLTYGADEVEFNPGVENFLNESKKLGIRNFILTSGLEDFVKKTKIASFFEEIYGTKCDFSKEKPQIEYLLTNDEKPKIIEKITNGICDNVIYVGDGKTDIPAFNYIKKHGGRNVLVRNRKINDKINNSKIIDRYVDADFSLGSRLYKYLKGE